MTPLMHQPPSRTRRIFANLALVAAAGVVALVVGEVVLRVVPIPGVMFDTVQYDPLTGGTLYPNTTKIYRSVHGDWVRRHVNSWGFLDREHTLDAPPGTVRIGFFGDSYTEARQVPLDSTFFCRIEAALDTVPNVLAGRGRRVESLAFGISGRSTLQSYLECTRWMDRAHLDDVVYVFCENDPADETRAINPYREDPYPVLSGDSIAVDYSFRDRTRYKRWPIHRVWQYIKAHSLVLSTVMIRLRMLERYGPRVRVTRAEMENEASPVRGAPQFHFYDESDTLFVTMRETLRRVLDAWRREVVSSGRRFVILYVPSQSQMALPVDEQKTWLRFLRDYCAAHDLVLVDPSSRLVAAESRGVEVYYDHFTPAGHRLVADAFVARFAAPPAAAQGAP